jgi:hypothetical protein
MSVAASPEVPSYHGGDELKWYAWHGHYDDLESVHSDRLEVVQELLGQALDAAPTGGPRAISICAGQARDLLPVLIAHPRGRDISVRLVELDPLNASFLYGALGSTDLIDVEVVIADAGTTDAYIDLGPADLVLLGGVFANIDAEDARRTIDILPALCRPGAVVVWSSYGPRLADVDTVVRLFERGGFIRDGLRWGANREFVVAAYRYAGPGTALPAGERFFRFADGFGAGA